MIDELLQKTVYGNTVLDYLLFLVTLAVGFLLIRILRTVAIARLKRWAARTSGTFDDLIVDMLQSALVPLLYYGVFYVGVRSLTLHPLLARVVDVAGVVLLTFIGVRLFSAFSEHMLRRHWTRSVDEATRDNSIKALLPAIHVTAWVLGIMYLLENLGFKISAVITGLGIGGIAVALAAQAVLGDLFSYFAILLDKPFEVGDFISVDDYMGSIEHVGVKTTRLRSLSGEELIFANSDLTKSRVHNYRRQETRRIEFTVRVKIDTPHEKAAAVPGILRDVITGIEGIHFDRAHLASIGEYSLNYTAVYILATPDYNRYMDIQQKINLAILAEFEQKGIGLAVPVRAVVQERGGHA